MVVYCGSGIVHMKEKKSNKSLCLEENEHGIVLIEDMKNIT